MAADKKISELPVISSVAASDVSVLVHSGTDYQYSFTTLLEFIQAGVNPGANISFGTTPPQNTTGKNGDVFINTSTGSFAQKQSGTWSVKYTLPTSGGTADGTVLYGSGVPGTGIGSNNDTYINIDTGIFYHKAASVWTQVFSMQTGPQGPKGDKGDTGTTGASGRAILNGTSNPSNSSTGTNGDFYLNTNTYQLFGPKTAGIWGSGTSIVGLTGEQGETGPQGDTGPTGEPGAGVATGGTSGQVLRKLSDADFDTGWVNAAEGGGITEEQLSTALTTKQNILINGESIKKINGQNLLGTGNIEISAIEGAKGEKGDYFIVGMDIPSAHFASYSLGVAGTTDSDNFGVPATDNKTIRVYKNVAGAGVYQNTQPWVGLIDYEFLKKAIDYGIVGRLAGYPILDLDSSEIFKSGHKIKNLATKMPPDERFLGADYKLMSAGATITPGRPDTSGGATGFQIDLPVNTTSGEQPPFFGLLDIKIPTGQWTVCYDIRLPDGSLDADVKINNRWVGDGFQISKTLTTAWQTISRTIVITGNDGSFGSYALSLAKEDITPTAAITVYVANIRVIAGATPINPPALQQSDVYAPETYLKIGERSEGMMLDMDNMGSVVMPFKFQNPILFNSFSIAIAFKLNNATGHNIIATFETGYIEFNNGMFRIVGGLIPVQSPSPMPLNQWMVLIATGNSKGSVLYVNGVKTAETNTAITPVTIKEFLLFNKDDAFTFHGEISSVALWKSKLSVREINSTTTTLLNRLVAKGISYHDVKTYWILEGDSITADGKYETISRSQFTPTLQGINYAVNGATLGNPTDDSGTNSIFGRQPKVNVDISGQIAAGRIVILSVLIGANGISGITTSEAAIDFYNKLMLYISNARTQGANVIVSTILDNSNITNKTYLNQINALILGDPTKYDAVADYYSSSLLTPATPTYFTDGQHPNATGQAVMADILLPRLEEFWEQ